MGKTEMSHRDRKRIQMQHALETAATQLVHQHGFDNVTVDDIATEAGVSKRTFFNYFACKEDAIVGPPPREPSDEEVSAFLAADHPNLARATLELFMDIVFPPHEQLPLPEETMEIRREIVGAIPELHRHHFARFHVAHKQVSDLVMQYLTAHPAARRTEAAPEIEAQIITGLAASAIHTGFLLRRHYGLDTGNPRDTSFEVLTLSSKVLNS